MKTSLEYLTSESKRRLDLIGGTAIAAALLPAAGVTALATEINTGSFNPLFSQLRVGNGNLPLRVLKFRTLPKTTDTGEMKTYGTYDPRASRLGLLMREVGVDEMPQLINVLRGEMSLVGMRPLLLEDIERLEGISPRLFRRWHDYYQNLRPGLTGPSQILRHQYESLTDEVWHQTMQMDIEYVKNASLMRDLRLLGSTPFKLLNARIHMVHDDSASESTAVNALT